MRNYNYTVNSNLSIISLNAQSIRAKFNEFQIAMNEINNKCHDSIICILQESWLSSECCTKMFELPDFQLISRGKYCSNHGGLLVYVHNDYYSEPLTIKEGIIGWEFFLSQLDISHRAQRPIYLEIFTVFQKSYFRISIHFKRNLMKLWTYYEQIEVLFIDVVILISIC